MENLKILATFLLYGSLVGGFMSLAGYVIDRIFNKGRYIPNILSVGLGVYSYILALMDDTGWVGLGMIIIISILAIANIISITLNILLKKLKEK
jgi:Flp pilus assembly protein protease CpaA